MPASCTFSQLKPTSPSTSNARRNSVGSNQSSSMRRASVAAVQPPCSACPANARLLTSIHSVSSRPGSNVRTATSAGHFGSRSGGSGARISYRSRSGRIPTRRSSSSASSPSCRPSTQSTIVPPPCAATCAMAARTSASRDPSRRASRTRTSPRVHCPGFELSLRATCAYAESRAKNPAESGPGSSRSSHTASPSAG